MILNSSKSIALSVYKRQTQIIVSIEILKMMPSAAVLKIAKSAQMSTEIGSAQRKCFKKQFKGALSSFKKFSALT